MHQVYTKKDMKRVVRGKLRLNYGITENRSQ